MILTNKYQNIILAYQKNVYIIIKIYTLCHKFVVLCFFMYFFYNFVIDVYSGVE